MLYENNGIIAIPEGDHYQYDTLSIDCMRKFSDQLDWAKLSRECHHWQSEEMIREFSDKIVWPSLVAHYTLPCIVSEAFITEFQEHLDWAWISRHGQLSECYIYDHMHQLDWSYLSGFQDLSERFIRNNSNRIDWQRIDSQRYSAKFQRDYAYCINWDDASDSPYLDIEFVRRNIHHMNWEYIWDWEQTEAFIRTFIQYVDWNKIWFAPHISEAFITEYMHMVRYTDDEDSFTEGEFWTMISTKSLSEAFIRKYKKHLEWGYISKHSKLSEALICENASKVCWATISKYQELSLPFIHKYQANLTMCKNIQNIIRRERAKKTIDKLEALPSELCGIVGQYL